MRPATAKGDGRHSRREQGAFSGEWNKQPADGLGVALRKNNNGKTKCHRVIDGVDVCLSLVGRVDSADAEENKQ